MERNTSNVFVTDAQMRSSLAVIRSLGKHGLDITAGEETRFATSFFSKYCKDKLVYPSPHKDTNAFVSYMLKQVEVNNYEAIFPITDSTVMSIAKHKEEFSKHTRVPVADYDTLMKGRDKLQTIEIATEAGIPCPKTYQVENISDLKKVKDDFEYPVVIKPRESCGSRGLTLCKSSNDVVSKFTQTVKEYGPSIIQEYIPPGGDEIGVYSLFNFDSKPRAVSVQRRIRSYPVSGGPSTLRETIKEPRLVETAFRLLKKMNWTGVAMVEFKIDPRDNEPKLMEVNPRFWGSLQLSILSGVDFPYLLYKLVTEGDIKPVLGYTDGVKCRWMLPGDILHFLSAPNKIQNFPEFIKFRGMNYDILSVGDYGPTFGFVAATLRYLFDRDMWKFVIRGSLQ